MEDLRHNKETSNDLVTSHLLAQTSQQPEVCLVVKMSGNEKEQNMFQRTESYYTELMLGRQFTGASFKVSGGGERRLDHSQIVGITNKKSCGEKKLSDGETVARSQQGFG